ncbi:MAG: hypothetical protein KY468_16160, partial [Armatimonadetes bacterium]|nr:hypothetical protein [Armatimonadota bacterium]
IRQRAREELRNAGDMDFTSLYRTAMEGGDERTLPGAIGGLSETGQPGDAALVLPYLGHPLVKVRKGVIRALARLDPAAHTDLFFAALIDGQAGISREGFEALASLPVKPWGERLWDIYASSSARHVRKNALKLLLLLPRWDRVPYLLRTVLDADAEFRERSEIGLRRVLWGYNRTYFVSPTAVQRERIRRVYEEVRSDLPESIRQEIMPILT